MSDEELEGASGGMRLPTGKRILGIPTHYFSCEKRSGKDFDVVGYNPDSGYIAFKCRKCGWRAGHKNNEII